MTGKWVLGGAAGFAMIWSIWRATQQAVTLDEADTYFWFASRGANFIWYPLPNNHLLNTLLMWVTTHALGLSALTMRLPALLGGAIYVGAVYFLCRTLTRGFALQFASFICLVYNPFVLDFFAAARGYSLATGFLLIALAIPVWHERRKSQSICLSTALASAAIGLSFAANFSFAFVDLAALAAILTWALRGRGPVTTGKVIGSGLLPFAGIAAGLCGYTIAHYSRKELWYGAHSLSEMAGSLVEATLYRIKIAPGSAEAVAYAGRGLLAAMGVICSCALIAGMLDRDVRRKVERRMAAGLAVILAVTLAAHYVAFRVVGLPLPLSRTAIYFLPLGTLLAALAAAQGTGTRVTRLLQHCMTALLVCLALHCMLCLRCTYFREYEWNADVKEVYRVMERLNSTYGVRDFASDGLYTSPLNWYRAVSRTERFPALANYPGMVPPGKQAYVLNSWYEDYQTFMKQQRLVVVYRGSITGVVVAVPVAASADY